MVGDQSLGIASAEDFVGSLLLPELRNFRRNPVDAPAAVRVAIFFTHLPEWVFHGCLAEALKALDLGENSPKDFRDFRTLIESECHHLRYLRDVCDGSKHATLCRGHDIVSSGKGEWGKVPFGEFPSNRLVLVLKLQDRTVQTFDYSVDKAVSFWGELFPELLK